MMFGTVLDAGAAWGVPGAVRAPGREDRAIQITAHAADFGLPPATLFLIKQLRHTRRQYGFCNQAAPGSA